jgi:hypothetical protein
MCLILERGTISKIVNIQLSITYLISCSLIGTIERNTNTNNIVYTNCFGSDASVYHWYRRFHHLENLLPTFGFSRCGVYGINFMPILLLRGTYSIQILKLLFYKEVKDLCYQESDISWSEYIQKSLGLPNLNR